MSVSNNRYFVARIPYIFAISSLYTYVFLPTSSSFHPGETILPLEWRNLFTLVMRSDHSSGTMKISY